LPNSTYNINGAKEIINAFFAIKERFFYPFTIDINVINDQYFTVKLRKEKKRKVFLFHVPFIKVINAEDCRINDFGNHSVSGAVGVTPVLAYVKI